MRYLHLSVRHTTYACLLGMGVGLITGSTWAEEAQTAGTTATGIVSPNTYSGTLSLPTAQKMANESLLKAQMMNQENLPATSLLQDNADFHNVQIQQSTIGTLNPIPLPEPLPLPIAPIVGGGGDLQLLEQELVQVNKEIKGEEAIINALSAACRPTSPPCDPDKPCSDLVRVTCPPDLQLAKQRLAELVKERATLVREIFKLEHHPQPPRPISPVPCTQNLSGDIRPCAVGPEPVRNPIKQPIWPRLPADPFTTAPDHPQISNQ